MWGTHFIGVIERGWKKNSNVPKNSLVYFEKLWGSKHVKTILCVFLKNNAHLQFSLKTQLIIFPEKSETIQFYLGLNDQFDKLKSIILKLLKLLNLFYPNNLNWKRTLAA